VATLQHDPDIPLLRTERERTEAKQDEAKEEALKSIFVHGHYTIPPPLPIAGMNVAGWEH
jgi:hypothetical protein